MTHDSPKGHFLDKRRIAIGSRNDFFGIDVAAPIGEPTIFLRYEGTDVSISPDELLLGMISYAKAPIQSMLSTVIESLLSKYEFLGYQMNLQLGNISEEDFASISTRYFHQDEDVDIQDLKRDINLLYGITGSIYTSDQLSLMFGCSIDKAEEALELLIAE